MRSIAATWGVLLCVLGCGSDETAVGGAGGTLSVGGGGAGGSGGQPPDAETAADRLLRYLTGHFDSVAQSEAEPAYFPIDLLTCAVDIPALGARTLHVEQSVIEDGVVGAPYRQRVYVVTDGADPSVQAISSVWEFVAPEDFAGYCSGGIDAPTAADLVERVGCQVELSWLSDHFEGSTPGKECLSDLNGATYATSEVSLFDDRIESWDRGYDSEDQQVWGATAGPYLFARLTPLDEP